VKRSPGLRALSSEHHTALVLARRAALAATGDAWADSWNDVAQRFIVEVEPHFRLEEEQLLPALTQTGEKRLVEHTLAEHAQLRALIYDWPHDAETLRAFAELLQAHVRFEERELFVIVQARLPGFSLETPA
jgi:hemerythrin-like domain-containing protein